MDRRDFALDMALIVRSMPIRNGSGTSRVGAKSISKSAFLGSALSPNHLQARRSSQTMLSTRPALAQCRFPTSPHIYGYRLTPFDGVTLAGGIISTSPT